MIPADLASRVRRWTLTSSVQEEGWRADRATVEYASVDVATFLAVADTINTASPSDSFVISYEVEGTPVEIFRGVVQDWRLEERWSEGGKETVGILEALDERGKLAAAAPVDQVFKGTQYYPNGSQVPYSDFLGVSKQLGTLVGVNFQGTYTYSLGQSLAFTHYSLAEAIAMMMREAQRIRSTRLDLVRDGDSFKFQRRNLVLGTPDVTIPRSIVKNVRSYRKTIPRDEETAPSSTQLAQEYTNSQPGDVAPPYAPPTGTYDLTVPVEGGAYTRYYVNGRLVKERTQKTLTPAAGPSRAVEDNVYYTYDSLGRPVRTLAQTFEDGVQTKEDDRKFTLDADGAVIVEQTVYRERNDAGALVDVKVVTNTKAATDQGTMKTLQTEDISDDSITVQPRAYEYSSGDTSSEPEYISPNTFTPQSTDVADAAAQADKFLVEASWEQPLDHRVLPGKVVEFSGGSLVDQVKFYVTAIEATWQAGGTHDMSVDGEVWV